MDIVCGMGLCWVCAGFQIYFATGKHLPVRKFQLHVALFALL